VKNIIEMYKKEYN